MNDGWHQIYGRSVYVENGRIKRGLKCNNTLPAWPYRIMRDKRTWINETGMTVEAFRKGVKRGTVDLF